MDWPRISLLKITILLLIGPCYLLDNFADDNLLFSVNNGRIVDKFGRTRLFHGLNNVRKAPPWYTEPSGQQLSNLAEFGLNSVRLGLMWSGVEPNEAQFNETYLRIIDSIISRYHKAGLYVILDLHQDVLSSQFKSYDGVPLWLMDKFQPPKHAFPWPLHRISSWPEGYVTEACSHAFQQLYETGKTYLERFWSMVAQRYRENNGVLGYELINEPWAGDIYENPALVLPGVAGRRNLMPLYEKLHAAIRRADQNRLVFFEPVTWGMVFGGKVKGTGFSSVPGGAAYSNRSVLSWHYYCWILPPDSHRSLTVIDRLTCQDLFGPKVFHQVRNDIARIGGASFLTEFGLCIPDGKNDSVNTLECEFVLQLADSMLESWTYWDSEFWYHNGSVNTYVARIFARTYPQATAGIPQLLIFRPETAEFIFKFHPNAKIFEPTVVFTPKIHYPHGFRISINPSLRYLILNDTSQVLIFNSQRHVQVIILRIVAC